MKAGVQKRKADLKRYFLILGAFFGPFLTLTAGVFLQGRTPDRSIPFLIAMAVGIVFVVLIPNRILTQLILAVAYGLLLYPLLVLFLIFLVCAAYGDCL